MGLQGTFPAGAPGCCLCSSDCVPAVGRAGTWLRLGPQKGSLVTQKAPINASCAPGSVPRAAWIRSMRRRQEAVLAGRSRVYRQAPGPSIGTGRSPSRELFWGRFSHIELMLVLPLEPLLGWRLMVGLAGKCRQGPRGRRAMSSGDSGASGSQPAGRCGGLPEGLQKASWPWGP